MWRSLGRTWRPVGGGRRVGVRVVLDIFHLSVRPEGAGSGRPGSSHHAPEAAWGQGHARQGVAARPERAARPDRDPMWHAGTNAATSGPVERDPIPGSHRTEGSHGRSVAGPPRSSNGDRSRRSVGAGSPPAARPGVAARPARRPCHGAHQMRTRSSGARAIGDPSGTPNAAAKSGTFESGPLTRNCAGAWGSTFTIIRTYGSVAFWRHIVA